MEKQVRYRAGIETTSKGLPSYSATVEITGGDELGLDFQLDTLARLDSLCNELDKRCKEIVVKLVE